MGRRAEGYRIVERGGIWTVRFRIDGQRHEYSTGIAAPARAKRPSEAADRAGRAIYAASIQGKRPAPRVARTATPNASLAELFGEWLDDLSVREPTRAQYEVFTVQWLREWRRLAELTDRSIATYFRRRLREVRRKSVLNESSALRLFLNWCVDTGQLHEAPTVPKEQKGTAFAVRRRVKAPELSAAEVEVLIAQLPEWSSRTVPELGRRKSCRGSVVVPWPDVGLQLRPAPGSPAH
jgi:hypothetical protein